MKELSQEGVVVACGGYPRYGPGAVIQRLENDVIVLVDGKGDGGEVEAEQ